MENKSDAMKAMVINADGTYTNVVPNNGTDFSLSELQKFVDGHIEVLFSLDGKNIMVLNEEGKIHDLPYNIVATNIANEMFGLFGDYIAGNVLVCDCSMIK